MKRYRPLAAPIALLVLGAAFVTIGLLLGQPNAVMQKAIRICLECIGIG